ncbi:recessive suppressor of secretory defect, putative [Entamoeba invadens IP1]|uniref:Recessive suppressor of secretory defect, putative n=1 Tax=Entamoeba invadens IP1 TaxID=370355 RepID=A0A0A1UFA3_ENTIV|nr:recessive suppressor of secretory defect, putative [Entamoeba invadens IP1]ELP95296.1 recessive suppressor of secretory defect, putative [Entamoeba invadens IP1]|eukprot:XP_004262067.1 recessive suppressor of secretory defect, putative [Entamoeba invadens IP1]
MSFDDSKPLSVSVYTDTIIISSNSSSDIQHKKNVFINRKTQQITHENITIQNNPLQVLIAECIYGIHKLFSVDYLIVVTQKKLVATIFTHQIFKIEKYEIVPVTEHSTKTEALYHRKVINKTFSSNNFYFSYTYDLTRPYSDQHNDPDELYLWNKNMFTAFPSKNSIENLLFFPTICGFVGKSECAISDTLNNKVELILISRRSNQHVGRRYYTRGSDENGYCANHVETEQIVIVNNNISSYIQLRGSIPLKWSQVPNFHYKPDIAICKDETANMEVMRRHFEDVLKKYNTTSVVSLVDKKGTEFELGKTYEKIVNKMANESVTIECIDFHQMMKKMNELLSYLECVFQRVNYGSYVATNEVVMTKQKGVFRVNCIDSLDRTNVCESVFGRLTAQQFLREVNVLPECTSLMNNKEFNSMFVKLWADNGDCLSWEYTGTGAQKGDITRNGKRTVQGRITDFVHSYTRYLFNNFFDGETVDCLNTFLGNCEGRCVVYELNWTQTGMVVGLLFSVLMFVVSICYSLLFRKIEVLVFAIVAIIFVRGIFEIGFIKMKKVTIPPKVVKFQDFEEDKEKGD